MPFKSEKQRKWMWANDPEMAKKWEKEEQKEAVQVDIDKVLKNKKIKKLMKRLGIRADKSKESALKILNYLARNPHALAAIKVAFESVKEERDYKAEYKKYGSSTKAKKYRAELNQYNRKKGTYGNNDGKDASHKGGKIVGFEKESTNRGRAEKSRLKKESVNEAKVLKFTDIKDRTLEKHLKVVTKKVGATIEKISGGFKVSGDMRALTAVVDYIFDKSIKKGVMKGGGMSTVNLVNEKISKEEWAEYPKYARKLKPYMRRLLKIPVKVRVIKQANHNPWIDVRVARFGKDVIPNDFRKRALKAIGGGRPRDMDNITYGNITAGSVSLKYDQWVKLLGNKVK
jgi:hypothetical protein